jgi:hypothetical protein
LLSGPPASRVELALLDLLCQLNATGPDGCGLEALKWQTSGESLLDWSIAWINGVVQSLFRQPLPQIVIGASRFRIHQNAAEVACSSIE